MVAVGIILSLFVVGLVVSEFVQAQECSCEGLCNPNCEMN